MRRYNPAYVLFIVGSLATIMIIYRCSGYTDIGPRPVIYPIEITALAKIIIVIAIAIALLLRFTKRK